MDLAKAIFITAVIGVIVTGGLALLPIALVAIIIGVQFIVVAWMLYPEADIDKELKIWKKD